MYFFYYTCIFLKQNKLSKQGQTEWKQNLRNNHVISIYNGLPFRTSMIKFDFHEMEDIMTSFINLFYLSYRNIFRSHFITQSLNPSFSMEFKIIKITYIESFISLQVLMIIQGFSVISLYKFFVWVENFMGFFSPPKSSFQVRPCDTVVVSDILIKSMYF